jgi:hypothetical protein
MELSQAKLLARSRDAAYLIRVTVRVTGCVSGKLPLEFYGDRIPYGGEILVPWWFIHE